MESALIPALCTLPLITTLIPPRAGRCTSQHGIGVRERRDGDVSLLVMVLIVSSEAI